MIGMWLAFELVQDPSIIHDEVFSGVLVVPIFNCRLLENEYRRLLRPHLSSYRPVHGLDTSAS